MKYTMVWVDFKRANAFDAADLLMAEDLALRIKMALENMLLNHIAEAAVKVREDFLSVASHELKTPLTPLKLQTQLITRTLKSDLPLETKIEKVDKVMGTFDKQIGRLSLLIDELLDVSRISNGKLSMKFERFDLVSLMQDVLSRFEEQLTSSGCPLSLEIDPVIPVHWDPFRIEQVFVNLLTNAIKYGHGKPIRIHAKNIDGEVMVSVTDGGIGIAPDNLGRIFGRFERAVSGDSFAGLGLGLYIVAQILEAHQGKIEVKSILGEGSTFLFKMNDSRPVVSHAESFH